MLCVKLFVMMKKKFKALNILVYIHQLHPTPFLRAHSFLRVVKMLYCNLILAKIILTRKKWPEIYFYYNENEENENLHGSYLFIMHLDNDWS